MDVEIDGEDLFDVEVLVDKLLIKEELQLQLTSASAESWSTQKKRRRWW